MLVEDCLWSQWSWVTLQAGRRWSNSRWPRLSPCPTGSFGQGGEKRKSANGTFPDSYPKWIRGQGGSRLGYFPTGKVVLSCVAWPPVTRTCLCGSINAVEELGSGCHASLPWHRAVDSSTEGQRPWYCSLMTKPPSPNNTHTHKAWECWSQLSSLNSAEFVRSRWRGSR